MRLIIENINSIHLYHISDVLTVKYNLPFGFLARLWIKFGKPSMIQFEDDIKYLFNGIDWINKKYE